MQQLAENMLKSINSGSGGLEQKAVDGGPEQGDSVAQDLTAGSKTDDENEEEEEEEAPPRGGEAAMKRGSFSANPAGLLLGTPVAGDSGDAEDDDEGEDEEDHDEEADAEDE